MNIRSGRISMDSLLVLCNQSDSNGKLYTQLRKDLLRMGDFPVIHLLEYKLSSEATESKSPPMRSMGDLFKDLEREDSDVATASLLHAILSAQVKPTFHKINVHAAMTPSEVMEHFEPVISQAKDLLDIYNYLKEDPSSAILKDIPFVTVRAAYVGVICM